MFTLNHHIYTIQNIRNAGAKSDDERFSDSLVAHALKTARVTLLNRKLSKYHSVAEFNYQTICMPLIKTTYYDCDCLPEDAECQILRSEEKLPEWLVSRMGSTLQIKYVDGRAVDHQPIKGKNYARYSLSNKEGTKWFIENSYLYVTGTLDLKLLIIKAIWTDPSDLANYTDCDGTTCYDPGTDSFPIDSELIDPLYKLTLQLLAAGDRYPEDIRNDSKDVQMTQTN